MRRLARLGSDEAARFLVEQWGDRADTWEVIEGIASSGSASAVAVLETRLGHRETTLTMLAALDDDALTRFAWEVDHAWEGWFPEELDPWHLRDAPSFGHTLLTGLIDHWGDDDRLWQLIIRMAEADCAVALRTLVTGRHEDPSTWPLVRRLAERGHAAALELLSQREGTPGAREILSQLATEGSPAAVEQLITAFGAEPTTWRLLDDLSDQAVDRLAEGPTGGIVWQLRFEWNRPQAVRLVRRMAHSPRRGGLWRCSRDH